MAGISSILRSSEKELSPQCGAATIEDAEGFDSVRSIVAETPWSGASAPFRANKLGAFPASPDSPPG